MELILQKDLLHQQIPIHAVCNALNGVAITSPVQYYENPQIRLTDRQLAVNLHSLQSAVPAQYRNNAAVGSCLNLDIKMETGTGKTYVYIDNGGEIYGNTSRNNSQSNEIYFFMRETGKGSEASHLAGEDEKGDEHAEDQVQAVRQGVRGRVRPDTLRG